MIFNFTVFNLQNDKALMQFASEDGESMLSFKAIIFILRWKSSWHFF